MSTKIDPSFAATAELIARKLADDKNVKYGSPSVGEDFILQKTKEIEKELSLGFHESTKVFALAGSLLQEELSRLPEIDPVKTELKTVLEKILVFKNPSVLAEKKDLASSQTIQEFLGLSHTAILSIYKIGERFFQDKEFHKSYALFRLVTQISPLISDYWIALALSQSEQNELSQALDSLAFAILLDPENPKARYHASKLYHALKQRDDALAELQALEVIIQSKQLLSLEPSSKKLRMLLNTTTRS